LVVFVQWIGAAKAGDANINAPSVATVPATKRVPAWAGLKMDRFFPPTVPLLQFASVRCLALASVPLCI